MNLVSFFQTFSSTWWCNTYIFILFLPFLSDGIKIATFLHIKGICMFYYSNNHQLCNERVVNCDKILEFHCAFTSPVSRFSFVFVCPFCCWGSIWILIQETPVDTTRLNSLPHGIIEARSDLELKPLWTTSSHKSQVLLYGIGHKYHWLIMINILKEWLLMTIIYHFLNAPLSDELYFWNFREGNLTIC